MFRMRFCEIFLTLVLLSSCSVQQFIKKVENQKIYVSPTTLERIGDSVIFELNAVLPRQIFHKNINYILMPEFHYERQVYPFDSEMVFRGKDVDPAIAPEHRQSFSMPFKDEMEKGSLEVYGVASTTNGWFKKRTSTVVLSRGVINTPSLTQLGQLYEREDVSQIGLYVPMQGMDSYGMFQDGWSGFKNLLMSSSKISFEDKGQYVSLIEGKGDFTFKERQLQGYPHYALIKQEIIPQIPNLHEGVGKTNLSPMEISVMANHILKNNAVPQVLSEADLAFAAMEEPRLGEKNRLFFAMVKAYPSVFSWNNLGVTYLNLYYRTFDRVEKLGYLRSAREAFEQANGFFENPYSSYNHALVLTFMGDYLQAYQKYFISMSLTQSPSLRKMHHGKLGAVSLLNGDYRLAVIHLDQAEMDEVNLFNKGLAYFMIRDFYNALIVFEDCALLNINNGYPFYGFALIAAKNGETGKLYENLEKAVEKSEFLRTRAPQDLEFRAFYQEQGFKEIFK